MLNMKKALLPLVFLGLATPVLAKDIGGVLFVWEGDFADIPPEPEASYAIENTGGIEFEKGELDFAHQDGALILTNASELSFKVVKIQVDNNEKTNVPYQYKVTKINYPITRNEQVRAATHETLATELNKNELVLIDNQQNETLKINQVVEKNANVWTRLKIIPSKTDNYTGIDLASYQLKADDSISVTTTLFIEPKV